MKPKLVINGAAGRMGKRITALAAESGAFEITAALEQEKHENLGQDAGIIAGIGPVNVNLTSHCPESCDVMIDFTLPQATDKTIENCLKNNIRLVIGTTGLSDRQIGKLQDASEKIPVILGSNMSVGMNVLFHLAAEAAEMLGPEYDIEIVEAHHRFKKDSPSGSALSLAQSICSTTDRDYPDCLVHGREGKETLRQKGTIGMHAVRGGDIIGRHSVIYSTLGETVKLSHNAHTRDNFVRGAIRAALWIMDKKPGMYSMTDVLGLKK